MKNFEYCTPTRIVFGKGVVDRLPELLAPYGQRVLLTYGGGSIKRSGLYDQVRTLLKDFEVYELAGIEPNPKYTQSVLPGVKLCKEKNIEVILSVGGGSVLDCSKAIAAGACYDGQTWDLISYLSPTTAALPIVDIMTMAATGSEYDAGCVISRTETNEKVGYISPYLYPRVSLLDPSLTATMPRKQTVAGVADAMNHVLEQFFTGVHTILNDGMCLAALKSLMHNVRIVLDKPDDYEARAEILYTCTLACNNIFSNGNTYSGWPMHAIEHTLSAFYDITHGEGLAILTPRWMRHILNEQTLERFVVYGTQLFGIDPSLEPMQIAEQAIQQTYDFFASLGLPMTLGAVGIDDSRIDEMARHTVNASMRLNRAWVPLEEADVAAIMRACL